MSSYPPITCELLCSLRNNISKEAFYSVFNDDVIKLDEESIKSYYTSVNWKELARLLLTKEDFKVYSSEICWHNIMEDAMVFARIYTAHKATLVDKIVMAALK
jgi:hypothetical protein